MRAPRGRHDACAARSVPWAGNRWETGSPAERQKKWRLQHPAARQKRRPVKTATADDYAERQAVVKACSALVERLRAILQTPPQEQSAKVALWRLGLEQAIAAIEEYRSEVGDLLV
jgi:hypothetical protein